MVCCLCLIKKRRERKKNFALTTATRIHSFSSSKQGDRSCEPSGSFIAPLYSTIPNSSEVTLLHYLGFGFRISGTEDHQIQEWLIQWERSIHVLYISMYNNVLKKKGKYLFMISHFGWIPLIYPNKVFCLMHTEGRQSPDLFFFCFFVW